MAYGRDPSGVGGDSSAELVLLVDHEVGGEGGQQRRQVGHRRRRHDVEEQATAGFEVGATALVLRHAVGLGGEAGGELGECGVDGHAHRVHGQVEASQGVDEGAGGGEGDVMAGVACGEGEREQRVHVAVGGPRC